MSNCNHMASLQQRNSSSTAESVHSVPSVQGRIMVPTGPEAQATAGPSYIYLPY